MRCIRTITKDDLQQFYQKYYVPNNIVISVVGDVTADHVMDRLKMAFAGKSKGILPKQRPIPAETTDQSTIEVIERPIDAAYFMFGFLAPGATSPDYPASRVAATALGRGKGSRMFRNIRDTKGLAYDLGTIYPTFRYQSHVLVYLIIDSRRAATKETVEEIKKAALDEIASLQNKPLSPEELERAKRYTIGSYALEHERIRDRAFHLGWLEAIGLGSEFDSDYASKLEAVTAEDVQRAAKQIFGNYSAVIVLPE
jgi:zinc protease